MLLWPLLTFGWEPFLQVCPGYEGFWDILEAGGKQVISMSDGNMDAYGDEVMACGTIGIISEPSTDHR
jgi:hypothetical protein